MMMMTFIIIRVWCYHHHGDNHHHPCMNIPGTMHPCTIHLCTIHSCTMHPCTMQPCMTRWRNMCTMHGHGQWTWRYQSSGVGHTTWVPDGSDRRSQADPLGQLPAQRAANFKFGPRGPLDFWWTICLNFIYKLYFSTTFPKCISQLHIFLRSCKLHFPNLVLQKYVLFTLFDSDQLIFSGGGGVIIWRSTQHSLSEPNDSGSNLKTMS